MTGYLLHKISNMTTLSFFCHVGGGELSL